MIATAQNTMPGSVEKMVQNASAMGEVDLAAAGHDSVLEPKYDGWRTIWIVGDDGKARFYSRKDQDLTGRWPAVETAIETALPAGTILDAEAVVFAEVDGHVAPKWGRVQSILGSGVAKAALMSGEMTLVVFDLLAHGGIDARSLPYSKRRELLEAIFEAADFPPSIVLTPQLEPTAENHDALLSAGYEGSMVKWQDAPYKSGARGAGWWKLKGQADVDVIVTGYKPGENGWVGLVGAVEFGQYDADGILVSRGRCSGMDFDLRMLFTNHPEKYLGTVFTMRHNGVFPPSKDHPHGAFRHPRFKRMRKDKAAEAVTLHDE